MDLIRKFHQIKLSDYQNSLEHVLNLFQNFFSFKNFWKITFSSSKIISSIRKKNFISNLSKSVFWILLNLQKLSKICPSAKTLQLLAKTSELHFSTQITTLQTAIFISLANWSHLTCALEILISVLSVIYQRLIRAHYHAIRCKISIGIEFYHWFLLSILITELSLETQNRVLEPNDHREIRINNESLCYHLISLLSIENLLDFEEFITCKAGSGKASRH